VEPEFEDSCARIALGELGFAFTVASAAASRFRDSLNGCNERNGSSSCSCPSESFGVEQCISSLPYRLLTVLFSRQPPATSPAVSSFTQAALHIDVLSCDAISGASPKFEVVAGYVYVRPDRLINLSAFLVSYMTRRFEHDKSAEILQVLCGRFPSWV
jgi:hypothetical protein